MAERYVYSPVGHSIRCEDCDWEAKSYKNAQATAAIHARKYGHKVSGELIIWVVYNARSVPKNE